MFVDALSRPHSAPVTVCSIEKTATEKTPPILDKQIIVSTQRWDKLLHQTYLCLKKLWPTTSKLDPKLASIIHKTHIFDDVVCTFDQSGKRVIWVPNSLRPLLLYLVHDRAGHFSAKYTLQKLKENWFWPGMTTDVDKFCASCDTCAQSKACLLYTSPSPRD